MAAAKTDENRDISRLHGYSASCGGTSMHETLRRGMQRHFQTECARALGGIGKLKQELDELGLQQKCEKEDLSHYTTEGGDDGEVFVACRCMGIRSPPISKKSTNFSPARTKTVGKRPRRMELGADYVKELVTSFEQLKPFEACVPAVKVEKAESRSESVKNGKFIQKHCVKDVAPPQSSQLDSVIADFASLKTSPRREEVKAKDEVPQEGLEIELEKHEKELSSLLKECNLEQSASAFMPYII